MDTFFASPERSNNEELQKELETITKNPVIDALMQSISGLLAVLNNKRQILLINDVMLNMIGIESSDEIFGKRHGEAIECIYANTAPSGCGTTKYCSTCGTAIAIVSSLKENKPIEKMCSATIKKDGTIIDICFMVRSVPINFEGETFILLFLYDITSQQAWGSIERVFFHDISNTLTALAGVSELICAENISQELKDILNRLVKRVIKEVEIQKILTKTKKENYELLLEEIPLIQIIKEVKETFSSHPEAKEKTLEISEEVSDNKVTTDNVLLMKTLTNMILNAFEASNKGEIIKFWIKQDTKNTHFFIWNKKHIPKDIKLRIFQRHFSTKDGMGRGIGTYSMKLFGEKFLKGKVSFTSSEKDGTTFKLTL